MSRGAELAKNTGIIALGTFLPKLAAFVTLPILTGLLTKEEYGTYDLVTVMVSLLLPALTLQIKAAAFRFLVDARDDKQTQSRIVVSILALAVPVSIVALLVLFFVLSRSIDPTVSSLVCLYYLADLFSGTFRQVARGLGRNINYSMSAVLSAAGKLVFAVVMVWWARLGLVGAVIALAMSSTVSALYLFYRLSLAKVIAAGTVDKTLLKQMISYSWPLVPNEISLWVIQMSNRLIITAFMGIAANAVFAVATKIPQLISLGQSAFTLAWQENASLAIKDEDASEYYSDMFKTMYGLQAGVLGLVVAFAPLLFQLLIRGDYGEAFPHIPILCLGIFFSSMSTFLGGIYVAHMASKAVGATTTAAAAVSVVLCLLLIRPIGLYAASVSTAISYLLLMVFRMYDVRKMAPLHYDPAFMAVATTLILVECVLSWRQLFLFDCINMVLAIVSFAILNKKLVATACKSTASFIRSLTNKKDKR